MQVSHSLRYYGSNALGWAALGLYTVSLSWLVLSLTHRASSVGIFFMAASASSLLVGPLAGPLLARPRHQRRIVLAAGAVRGIALILPAMLRALDLDASDMKLPILAVAVLFGPANSLYGAASEGQMLGASPGRMRHRIARRVGLVRQIALSAGFGTAGFLVMQAGAETTSALAAVLGMAGVLIGLLPVRLPERIGQASIGPMPTPSPAPPFFLRLTAGVRFIGTTPGLIFPCAMATLGFSVSQMSNASLAPIMAAQRKPAGTLGLIAAAWAAGAIGAALIANMSRAPPTGQKNSPLFLLLLLGVSCMAFSASRSTTAQMVLFAAMGAIFSWLRIGAHAEIALQTPADRIALVQLALSNLVSLTALAIYLVPSLLNRMPPSGIFALWGGIVVLVAAGTWTGLRIGASRVTAPTRSRAPAPPDR